MRETHAKYSVCFTLAMLWPFIAASSSFAQTGVGGTAAIWQGAGSSTSFASKGPSPWIDVTAYGAVPDWTILNSSPTDNTTALATAIAACPSTGCTIFFPVGSVSGGPGNYYVKGSGGFGMAIPATLSGVRLVGGCSAVGSAAPSTTPITCSTIVSDQAIVLLQVGNSTGKLHGFTVEGLGFKDVTQGGNNVLGGIHLLNVEDFNLSDIRCQDIDGYCIQPDGGSGANADFTQFGVIVNPSVSNTRFPIQTKNSTSEINVYGGNLGCTNMTGTPASIGMDLGQTSHPTGTVNGEWGVYGTHILDCSIGVSAYNANVLQFYGVAEIGGASGTPIAGSIGVLLDADSGKGGGAFVSGSLNNFETCLKITANPFNTRVTASLTPHMTTTPPTLDAALDIHPSALPTTLILTPVNFPQATQSPFGIASGSQLGSDLVLFSDLAPTTPLPRSVLTTIANDGTTGTTSSKLAKLTSASPSTVVKALKTDTQVTGIVVNGDGTTAGTSAQIATVGQANCAFDNTPIAGEFVTISSAVDGDCHDYGGSPPPAGQILGRVLVSGTSQSTQPVLLFGPDRFAPAPQLRNSVTLTDDFFAVGTTATVGELQWAFANTTPTKLNGVANHPGILQIVAAGMSGGGPVAQVFLGSSSSNLPIASLSSVPFQSVFVARLESPVSSLHARIGFTDSPATPPTNGIFFDGTSGVWTGTTTSSTGTSTTTGTVSFDTNFHTFEIRNDGANDIGFWVDGSQLGVLNSNVPGGALQPFFQIQSGNTANKTLDIDAFQFTMTVVR